MVRLPYPLKSNGFIDEEELFKLVVGTLKVCSFLEYESFMETAQPFEIGLLLENHYEKEQEKYELMAYAFQVGYIRAKTGKKIEMFEKKQDESKTTRVTKEQKEQEYAYLFDKFED